MIENRSTIIYMTKQRKIIGSILVVLILVVGYEYVEKDSTLDIGDTYLFTCKDKKTIVATFYPKNDTEVSLDLSDGRSMKLPHVISASGARYANKDESIVFWNKGNTAFINEGTSTTYKECITREPNPLGSSTPSTVKGTVNDGLYGYANAEYGFTMRFPPEVRNQNSFSTFYILGNNWRVNPSQANQGKPVVSFVIKQIDQGSVATGKAYPLFFDAEVRVGVSTNVKLCYEKDAGYANQKVTDVNINGVMFKKFSFSDAAMMKYIQGESYRTIHDNKCYVLEQLKEGSNYRDPSMTAGLSDSTLNAYYNVGETIIKTFKFTK